MSDRGARGGAFVGLDLGTSGLKAIALDQDARVLARAGADYPTAHPHSGAYEQDAMDWASATVRAVRKLLAQLGEEVRVRALGLSAMLPSLVLADPAQRPVAPAITWQDARAEQHGARLRDAVGADELYRLTGQWLDGRYLLPMYLAARSRGAVPDHVPCLLGAKDWLLGWLTRTVATDPSTAAGVGAYLLDERRWYQPVLDAAAGIGAGPLPALPDVVPSETTFALHEPPAAALGLPPGVPVCVGGADSVLAAFGLGATAAGQVAYVAGTSTAILGIAERWRPDPKHRYLGTPLATSGGVGLEMDLLSTGAAIRWLAGLLNLAGEAELVHLAATVAAEDAPVVLPYLTPGEQGALWDPRLRGAITGLSLQHGPAHLARGLLTGIALESSRCLATLAEAGIGSDLRAAGGSGSDPSFLADLADACARRVAVAEDGSTDYSAAGAARLAAAAIGEPIAAPAPLAEQHRPRADRAALWARLAQRHDRTRIALHEPEQTEES